MSIKKRFHKVIANIDGKFISHTIKEMISFVMLITIVTKTFLKYEDWLFLSVVYFLSYFTGYMIMFVLNALENNNTSYKKIIQFEKKSELGKKIIKSIKIIFWAGMILAFVLGVVLNISNYFKLIRIIIIPFGVSILLNTIRNEINT